ncbi:hypothetical protein AAZX31_14G156800 [Glycine max]
MSTNYNIIWSSPKLDQKLDFYCWETLMATNLRTHNIWSFVEMRLAEEVVAYFIFGKIVNAKTTKETWDILKFSYKGEEKAQTSKLQSLQREYERVYGEDIPDNKVVDKILHTR